jgi:hypothetical protein
MPKSHRPYAPEFRRQMHHIESVRVFQRKANDSQGVPPLVTCGESRFGFPAKAFARSGCALRGGSGPRNPGRQ